MYKSLFLILACMLGSSQVNSSPIENFSENGLLVLEDSIGTFDAKKDKKHDHRCKKPCPRGFRGPRGNQGPIGLKGATGPEGFVGKRGERGPIGEQGPTGPTNTRNFATLRMAVLRGLGFSAGFAIAYNFNDKVLETNGGISVNVITGVISVDVPGNYRVNYGIINTNPNVRIGVEADGALVPGTILAPAVGNQLTSQSVIIGVNQSFLFRVLDSGQFFGGDTRNNVNFFFEVEQLSPFPVP